jgi:uncharacterized membrane protein
MSTIAMSRRRDWIVPAGLILMSLVPAAAGTARLVELARGAAITAANARFFAMPLPVILHIVSVIPFSILGALQVSPAFRHRHRAWHRRAGKALIVFGMVAAMTGLWMTQFYPWPKGDGELVYLERLVFGTAMAVSIVLGIDAIRRHDYAAHGRWMLRGYAIGMGAATQVLTHLPYFIFAGKPDESVRAVLMGAGWVINVVIAEWIIRGRPAFVPIGIRHRPLTRGLARP